MNKNIQWNLIKLRLAKLARGGWNGSFYMSQYLIVASSSYTHPLVPPYNVHYHILPSQEEEKKIW